MNYRRLLKSMGLVIATVVAAIIVFTLIVLPVSVGWLLGWDNDFTVQLLMIYWFTAAFIFFTIMIYFSDMK